MALAYSRAQPSGRTFTVAAVGVVAGSLDSIFALSEVAYKGLRPSLLLRIFFTA